MWRHFGAPYTTCDTKYDGVDQIAQVITQIEQVVKTKRANRRILQVAWDPSALPQMALPPCHVLAQWHVDGNFLSCELYQRSGDLGLGIPFNIASYSAKTHLIAKRTGLIAKELIHHIGNAHVYENHVDALLKQVKREPYKFPTLEIKGRLDTYLKEITAQNFKLHNYKYHEPICMEMSI